MLVLAMEFSKGGDGATTHDDLLAAREQSLAGRVVRGTPLAAGASAPCRREGEDPEWVGSLKTEEKTRSADQHTARGEPAIAMR